MIDTCCDRFGCCWKGFVRFDRERRSINRMQAYFVRKENQKVISGQRIREKNTRTLLKTYRKDVLLGWVGYEGGERKPQSVEFRVAMQLDSRIKACKVIRHDIFNQ